VRVLPPTPSGDEAPPPFPPSPPSPARESPVSLHRTSRRRRIGLAAAGAIALIGVLVAVLASRDDGGSREAVTVVRTATVAGTPRGVLRRHRRPRRPRPRAAARSTTRATGCSRAGTRRRRYHSSSRPCRSSRAQAR
jgi:hypothetical protein